MGNATPKAEAVTRGARMLRTALGPDIATFLEDPAVVEVMLNPDGRLWIDRLSEGLSETGAMLVPADGERIIRLVAHHVGAEVHSGAPRVSAELPGTGERFEATGTITVGSQLQFSQTTIDISVGENLEVDPPHRLVQTFNAMWADEVKAEPTSRVTWEISQIGTSCRLTVTHDQLRDGANNQLYGGWPMILSGLKTLLETGELLDTPGSLQYVDGVES